MTLMKSKAHTSLSNSVFGYSPKSPTGFSELGSASMGGPKSNIVKSGKKSKLPSRSQKQDLPSLTKSKSKGKK